MYLQAKLPSFISNNRAWKKSFQMTKCSKSIENFLSDSMNGILREILQRELTNSLKDMENSRRYVKEGINGVIYRKTLRQILYFPQSQSPGNEEPVKLFYWNWTQERGISVSTKDKNGGNSINSSFATLSLCALACTFTIKLKFFSTTAVNHSFKVDVILVAQIKDNCIDYVDIKNNSNNSRYQKT